MPDSALRSLIGDEVGPQTLGWLAHRMERLYHNVNVAKLRRALRRLEDSPDLATRREVRIMGTRGHASLYSPRALRMIAGEAVGGRAPDKVPQFSSLEGEQIVRVNALILREIRESNKLMRFQIAQLGALLEALGVTQTFQQEDESTIGVSGTSGAMAEQAINQLMALQLSKSVGESAGKSANGIQTSLKQSSNGS